ncbi:MAG: amidase domain-containing protein [Clostridia bacterium]|nr:amidase domain-containing protein [Clostridia bacterium]
MLIEIGYNRSKVIDYAEKWAFSRNPRYMDFQNMGGDCTNFASQCIFAGCGVMNYAQTFGWYYINASKRTASWTGVPFLYNFLVANRGQGPYAAQVERGDIDAGDIVQLGNADGFYHSPVVCRVNGGEIYVAAHTFDAYMRPLSSYYYDDIRYVHIAGARQNI